MAGRPQRQSGIGFPTAISTRRAQARLRAAWRRSRRSAGAMKSPPRLGGLWCLLVEKSRPAPRGRKGRSNMAAWGPACDALIGKKFGRWSVLEIEPPKRYRKAKCRCECGIEREVLVFALRSGRSSSCGCLKAKRMTRHGDSGRSLKRLYRIWSCIKCRCYQVSHIHYKNYGGRGIVVCEEWRNSYENFRAWSLVNGYEDRLQIDRRDNNSGYSPENCRWVTPAVNATNRRNNRNITAFGTTKTLSEWVASSVCSIQFSTLRERLRRGWSPERAITEPLFGGG